MALPPPAREPPVSPPPGRGALRGRATEKGRLVWAPPIFEGAPRRRYHQHLLRGGAAVPPTPPPLGSLGVSSHKSWLTRGAPTYAL